MVLYPLLFSLISLIFGYDEAEIVFAGDAMMHQSQLDVARQADGTYDYSEYFSNINQYVSMADYAVVNLETPVSRPPYAGYPCFNSPESYISALKDAGFDMFLTANNHCLDRRDRGLKETIDVLDRYKLDHIGTYKTYEDRTTAIPLIKEINNIKVGFLNYTYGTNGITPGDEVVVDYINREQIKRDVDATRQAGAEIIIACPHWGVEYNKLPNASQKSLAEYLQSLGVEIIIGGHPHVIQPFEMTNTPDGSPQLLVYSLGNFISNMKTTDTRGGAMVKIVLRRDDTGKVKLIETSYRLVYTEPANGDHNFRLEWVDDSSDPRAAAFANAARNIFRQHNINVEEDIPGVIRKILQHKSQN